MDGIGARTDRRNSAANPSANEIMRPQPTIQVPLAFRTSENLTNEPSFEISVDRYNRGDSTASPRARGED